MATASASRLSISARNSASSAPTRLADPLAWRVGAGAESGIHRQLQGEFESGLTDSAVQWKPHVTLAIDSLLESNSVRLNSPRLEAGLFI
jgi:hypothetical protein